ncbi:Ger(x)C family germination protein [Paenibacillus sp. BK033]|nr:Ger(x)C family germination protein [Paenibacillus sp. BK033]
MRKLILALCMLGICPGCWDMKEINQLALVDTIAMDQDDNRNFHFYFQVLNPPSIEARGSGPSRAAVYTYEVSAPAIGLITKKTEAVMSRKLYTSHMQVYVLSERSARNGVLSFVNLLENDPERRTNVYTIVTEEPVSTVMNSFTVLDRVPGRNIRLLLDWHAKNFGINKLPIRMKDIVAGIPFSRPTIIPIIQYTGERAASKADRLDDINATKENLRLVSGAVFIRAKMVGKINTEIKNLYYVFNGYAKRIDETVEVRNKRVDIEVRDIKIKRIWKTEKQLILRLNAKAGIINNEQNQRLNASNIKELEQAINSFFNEKGEDFFRFALKQNWDLLGIGDTRQGRKNWKEIKVQFDTHSKVTSLGNTITPYE